MGACSVTWYRCLPVDLTCQDWGKIAHAMPSRVPHLIENSFLDCSAAYGLAGKSHTCEWPCRDNRHRAALLFGAVMMETWQLWVVE